MPGETLRDFFVSIGVKLDEPMARKATQDHAAVEKRITSTNQVEADRRDKLDVKSTDRRRKLADEEFKRDRERRSEMFKDLEKHAVQFEAVASRVASVVGGIGATFAGSVAYNAIVNTAGAFSRLSMEAQRSGASPRNIERLVFALGQLGVNKEEARGSFDAFASLLIHRPGFKESLAKSGINTRGDNAQVMANLGKYFSGMDPVNARIQADRWGISPDTMLTLEKQAELQSKMGDYDRMSGGFGLDPDKAAKDGREFTAAYDKLATDLQMIQQKIETTVFKPLAAGMGQLSDYLEKNPEKVTAITAAFEGLAAILSAKVIVQLAKVAGMLGSLRPPAWLAMLGLAEFADSQGALKGPQAGGKYGAIGEGLRMLDPGLADRAEAPGGTDAWIARRWRNRPTWLGGRGSGAHLEDRRGTQPSGSGPAPSGDVAARGLGTVDTYLSHKMVAARAIIAR